MRLQAARVLFICLVVPLLLFAIVLASPPASAGGSWLEVVEVSNGALSPPGGGPAWAAVGATVRMRGGFCSGSQANPSQGPWYASLRPGTGGPRTLLGPVEIVTGHNSACPWVATVSFVVPAVAAGSYWVDVCDEGCTTGVGDLVGGYFVVASSGSEARLVQRLTTLKGRYEHARINSRIFRHRMEGLEARIDDMRHQTRRLGIRLEEAAAAQAQTIADVQLANDAAARERMVSDRWRLLALVTALTLVLTMSIFVTSSVRGRRLRGPAIPTDTSEEPQASIYSTSSRS